MEASGYRNSCVLTAPAALSCRVRDERRRRKNWTIASLTTTTAYIIVFIIFVNVMKLILLFSSIRIEWRSIKACFTHIRFHSVRFVFGSVSVAAYKCETDFRFLFGCKQKPWSTEYSRYTNRFLSGLNTCPRNRKQSNSPHTLGSVSDQHWMYSLNRLIYICLIFGVAVFSLKWVVYQM